jgi:hypothetical protein
MDALEAGDSTMVRTRLDGLKAKLADLRSERLGYELSSSRAWISGKLGRIDDRIIAVRREIETLEADA